VSSLAGRAATLNLRQLEGPGREQDAAGRSPLIMGKRALQQQRKSRTIHCSPDESEAAQKKQKPVRASDELKVYIPPLACHIIPIMLCSCFRISHS